MEIVLNIDSKRKTATAVAFRDGERSFEGEAENIGVKFPHLCYKYFLDLLGKRMDHPSVKSFQVWPLTQFFTAHSKPGCP